MTRYLITGTNRGIGHEFLRQLSANPGDSVVAVVRDKTKFTGDLKLNVELIAVDMVASLEEFHEAFSVLKGKAPIDVVIHNAGVATEEMGVSIVDHTYSEFTRITEVNYFGTVKLYKALDPYFAKPLKFIYISTEVASISGLRLIRTGSYGASKAAGNFVIKQISVEREGDIVIPISPGPVDTDMAASIRGMFDLLTPEFSVSSMLAVINGLKPEDTGKFYNYDGREIPY